MSGDSQHYKKYNEVDVLPDLKVLTVVNVSPVIDVAQATSDMKELDKMENKQVSMRQDIEDTKEAAGDTIEINSKNEKQGIDTDDIENTYELGTEYEKRMEDMVDSVVIQPPLPQNICSATSIEEQEEECVVKCLYYTLQCCDCVLM